MSPPGRDSESAKQQRFNVPCALQDVDHRDLLRLQAVNNQVIALVTAAP
jgi:hypothetical protein